MGRRKYLFGSRVAAEDAYRKMNRRVLYFTWMYAREHQSASERKIWTIARTANYALRCFLTPREDPIWALQWWPKVTNATPDITFFESQGEMDRNFIDLLTFMNSSNPEWEPLNKLHSASRQWKLEDAKMPGFLKDEIVRKSGVPADNIEVHVVK